VLQKDSLGCTQLAELVELLSECREVAAFAAGQYLPDCWLNAVAYQQYAGLYQCYLPTVVPHIRLHVSLGPREPVRMRMW
jgi:hypothetical protein